MFVQPKAQPKIWETEVGTRISSTQGCPKENRRDFLPHIYNLEGIRECKAFYRRKEGTVRQWTRHLCTGWGLAHPSENLPMDPTSWEQQHIYISDRYYFSAS